MDNVNILVLIPCFNEEKNIENVIHNVCKYSLSNDHPKYNFNYLIINDCSKDQTLNILKNNKFSYLNLSVNLGIGGCVQTGYKYALEHSYDITIQHDGDGQHDPSYFFDVIDPIITEKADIVIGSRFIDKNGFQSTSMRRLGSKFISLIIRLCTGVKVTDVTSGYRAVNRKFIEFYAKNYAQDYPEPEAIVDAVKNNAHIIEIPVTMQERQGGTSSITALKSIYYMIKVSLAILLYNITSRKKI